MMETLRPFWGKQRKIVLLLLGMVLVNGGAWGQLNLNLHEHDNKPYYFGITLSTNISRFHTELHPSFLRQDSVLVAEPANAGGFALGLLATARLTERFEARFNPVLSFMDRGINYQLRYADLDRKTDIKKRVESVIVSFPVHFKFNSDRIGNFRVYMLGGGKLDYDLASNARARKVDELVKIQKIDYGVEAGLGFNFYFPSFIFSPEIKLSNGLRNIHARNEALRYSSVLDRIQSRMIIFSIHLEG